MGTDDSPSALDALVDTELFSDSVDSVDAFLRRRQAAYSDPQRYALLYYLCTRVEETAWDEDPDYRTRAELVDVLDIDDDAFDELVDPLVRANLLTVVPISLSRTGDRDAYHPSELGRDLVEADRAVLSGRELV